MAARRTAARATATTTSAAAPYAAAAYKREGRRRSPVSGFDPDDDVDWHRERVVEAAINAGVERARSVELPGAGPACR